MEDNKKYALVTGGTGGIGLELVKLFAADGYNLIIVARNEGELDKTAEETKSQFGVDVITISKDLFDPQSASEIYDEVKAKEIEIDVLVNDAGQGLYGKFIDTDLGREVNIIHLNIISLISLTKPFLKDMVARGSGKILNLSSLASKIPGPWQSVYHGTKAFVQSFTEAVRSEVKDTGVTLTALLPGAVDTDFFNKADMLDSKITDSDLYDPAKVAKDGYKALMAGDDKVVSGFMTKTQVAFANVTPDSVVADLINKQQSPKGT